MTIQYDFYSHYRILMKKALMGLIEAKSREEAKPFVNKMSDLKKKVYQRLGMVLFEGTVSDLILSIKDKVPEAYEAYKKWGFIK